MCVYHLSGVQRADAIWSARRTILGSANFYADPNLSICLHSLFFIIFHCPLKCVCVSLSHDISWSSKMHSLISRKYVERLHVDHKTRKQNLSREIFHIEWLISHAHTKIQWSPSHTHGADTQFRMILIDRTRFVHRVMGTIAHFVSVVLWTIIQKKKKIFKWRYEAISKGEKMRINNS